MVSQLFVEEIFDLILNFCMFIVIVIVEHYLMLCSDVVQCNKRKMNQTMELLTVSVFVFIRINCFSSKFLLSKCLRMHLVFTTQSAHHKNISEQRQKIRINLVEKMILRL